VAEQQSHLVRNRREEWATREHPLPEESNPPHGEPTFWLHQRVSVTLDFSTGRGGVTI